MVLVYYLTGSLSFVLQVPLTFSLETFFIRQVRSGCKGGEKVITYYGSASSLGTSGSALTLQLFTQ